MRAYKLDKNIISLLNRKRHNFMSVISNFTFLNLKSRSLENNHNRNRKFQCNLKLGKTAYEMIVSVKIQTYEMNLEKSMLIFHYLPHMLLFAASGNLIH